VSAIDAAAIKRHAKTLGFDLVGVAPIQPSRKRISTRNGWRAVRRGNALLERGSAARMDPATLLPGARSVIVGAINYNTDCPFTGVDRLRAWYRDTLGGPTTTTR